MGWNYHNKPPLGWPIDWDHPLTKGLIACWLMNKRTGQKVFDVGRNKIDGILTSNPTWSIGKFGHAVHNDASSYINVTHNGLLTSTEGTFVFWAKDDNAATNRGYVGFYYDAENYIRVHNDGTYFETRAETNNVIKNIANAFPLDSFWHQHVVTYKNGNHIRYYMDGIEGGTAKTWITMASEPSTIQLGSSQDAAICAIAYYDHWMVFNRALTADEIAQFYREPFAMFKNPDEISVLDQYYAVGDAGIMTLNTGYWGPTY